MRCAIAIAIRMAHPNKLVPRLNYEHLRALGARLSAWRDAADRTQTDVAAALGARQPMLSEWERGTRCPPTHIQSAIETMTGGIIPAAEWAACVEMVPAKASRRKAA